MVDNRLASRNNVSRFFITTDADSFVFGSIREYISNPLTPNLITESTIETITQSDAVYYFCDTVISENHKTEIEITDNAVESGAVLSDHFYAKPREVAVEAIVSDTTILTTADGSHYNYPIINGTSTDWNDAPSRSVDCFTRLSALQRSGQFLTVGTSLVTYPNMTIVGIKVDRTKSYINALRIVLNFREVITSRQALIRIAALPDAPVRPVGANQRLDEELRREERSVTAAGNPVTRNPNGEPAATLGNTDNVAFNKGSSISKRDTDRINNAIRQDFIDREQTQTDAEDILNFGLSN